MVMWEECRSNAMLTNTDDFEDDTTLWLNLSVYISNNELVRHDLHVYRLDDSNDVRAN